MNAPPALDMQGLLRLASDSSTEARRQIVNVIADLFDSRGELLNERERALMSDILRKLIHEFEMAVRYELSTRLAGNKSVPADLMVMLAKDEIEVARPVLLRSEVLGDEELVDVITHRTQQHQLAIAMRRSISESVSEALAATENVDVVRALLENEDAHISAATMAYLVEESQRIDSYQEPLVRRRDLDPALAKRMLAWVSAALRRHIVDTYDIDADALDDALEEVFEAGGRGATPDAGEPSDDVSKARALASRLGAGGHITPELLVRVLRQGEIPLFEALFGELTGLPDRRVRSIAREKSGRMLCIACRAADIDKGSFGSIYLLRAQDTDRRVRDPRELARVMKLFDSVRPEDAVRIVKLWKRAPEYVAAIEKLGTP